MISYFVPIPGIAIRDASKGCVHDGPPAGRLQNCANSVL
jgi:hypothetical protein